MWIWLWVKWDWVNGCALWSVSDWWDWFIYNLEVVSLLVDNDCVDWGTIEVNWDGHWNVGWLVGELWLLDLWLWFWFFYYWNLDHYWGCFHNWLGLDFWFFDILENVIILLNWLNWLLFFNLWLRFLLSLWLFLSFWSSCWLEVQLNHSRPLTFWFLVFPLWALPWLVTFSVHDFDGFLSIPLVLLQLRNNLIDLEVSSFFNLCNGSFLFLSIFFLWGAFPLILFAHIAFQWSGRIHNF